MTNDEKLNLILSNQAHIMEALRTQAALAEQPHAPAPARRFTNAQATLYIRGTPVEIRPCILVEDGDVCNVNKEIRFTQLYRGGNVTVKFSDIISGNYLWRLDFGDHPAGSIITVAPK